VVVDLGARGLLFGLLVGENGNPDYAWMLPGLVFERRGIIRRENYIGSPMDQLTQIRPKAEFQASKPGETPFPELPMLVRFRDIADPKTVERVDPNDLAASFGPGVKFSRATIEIVDDPVTTGIEKRLVWWNGPFPWLKPLGNGVYVDTRTDEFKVTKDQIQQGIQ
jgi:hypothetical protein